MECKLRHKVALLFVKGGVSLSTFSMAYWVLSSIEKSRAGVPESVFWAIFFVAPPVIVSALWPRRWFHLLWYPLLFVVNVIFQYWFLSLSDYFSIGDMVVFDGQFTSSGLLIVFLVPALLVGLSAFSVFLGAGAQSMLIRYLKVRTSGSGLAK